MSGRPATRQTVSNDIYEQLHQDIVSFKLLPESLINKSEFIGLDNIAHLATGGESPMLRSHQQVLQQFLLDKSAGEPARDLQAQVMEQAKGKCATLFKVPRRS